MHRIRGVIFDFDGVILDSANIKTEAFLELFEEYPKHQETIKEYHIEHQGITRFQKFEWIYKELLKKPYNEEIKQKLGEKFSEIVFSKIMETEEIPGAIEFLKILKTDDIPAFIASGTPDEELEKIVRDRGLSEYFKTIYGSNISKEEAIDRISEQELLPYPNLLFVGDAVTDYRAAKSRKVPFVAVYSEVMEDYWKEREIKPVHNLMEIVEEKDQLVLQR